ncbi:hypothetical protein EYF80_046307 [Liparis tanakae]|uniref:Uncharacterized protein n=1 Tax=Liparis tanakae TaxID=230148 RepID=A0A4Z2FRD7_9TELE|nr:hypothetical protein EYF80_046307 [Liparis tanakae]
MKLMEGMVLMRVLRSCRSSGFRMEARSLWFSLQKFCASFQVRGSSTTWYRRAAAEEPELRPGGRTRMRRCRREVDRPARLPAASEGPPPCGVPVQTLVPLSLSVVTLSMNLRVLWR